MYSSLRVYTNHERPYFLIWEEGKSPQIVIELTSPSTKAEDINDKFALYQDTLKIQEYILFDPLAEYLDPPLRGYRPRKGKYQPIPMLEGRLPSKVLDLHLERDGRRLRLWNPKTQSWLRTPQEEIEALRVENSRLKKKARRSK